MSSEGGSPRQDVNSKSFDLLAIVNAIWLPFIVWAAGVIGVAFGGRQPGVVCVTARRLVDGALGRPAVCRALPQRLEILALTEAGLAGGIFGLLQGLLFTFVAPFTGSIQPEEKQKAILISVVMIVLGAVVSAVLSMVIGATQERRRTAK